MKKFSRLIGFTTLLLLGLILYFIVSTIINAFIKLGQPLQASIISGIALVVVAVVSFIANKSIQIKQLTDQSLRTQKVELYQEFFKLYLRVLGKEGIVEKPTTEEIQKFFTEKTPVFLSFASNEVISKWGRLRISPVDPNDKTCKSLFQLEDLIFAIRRDLGHGRLKTKKGDALRLFVNDIDKYI